MTALRGLRGAWCGVALALVLTAPPALDGVAYARPVKIIGSCTGGCTWKPSFKRIAKGKRVVWKVPAGDTRHTVTAYRASGSRRWSFNVTLDPGEHVTKRFRRRGLYRYLCTIHPTTMRGTIRVHRRR
jgi:plastocyanin